MKVYDGAQWDLVAPDTSAFIDKAILTAKGALISASGASTPSVLTVASTNGYILAVDSATTSGLAWIANDQGDITAVSAGTGITVASSTGPIPTVAIDATVATLTGTQTLTNKTLTTPIISTISNTGTVTLPTATDTLVGRATTDTLTNKTISGASNTLTNIGNASLTNSSITLNGTPVSLGGSATIDAGTDPVLVLMGAL